MRKTPFLAADLSRSLTVTQGDAAADSSLKRSQSAPALAATQDDALSRAAPQAILRAVLRGGSPQIAALQPGHSGMVPFEVTRAGHRFFAKVALPEASAVAQLRHEATWGAWAALLGAGPKPLPEVVRGVGANQVMLTNLVPGRPLKARDARDDTIMKAALARLRLLHEAPAPRSDAAVKTPWERVASAVDEASRRGVITSEDAAWVRGAAASAWRALVAHAAPPVPVHGDFQQRNVLWNGRDATLIDFADAGLGEAMQDLAHFALDAELPMHDMARLVRLYEKSDEASEARLVRLQLCMRLYRLARYAEWTCWQPGGTKVAQYRAFAHDDLRELAEATSRALRV